MIMNHLEGKRFYFSLFLLKIAPFVLASFTLVAKVHRERERERERLDLYLFLSYCYTKRPKRTPNVKDTGKRDRRTRKKTHTHKNSRHTATSTGDNVF